MWQDRHSRSGSQQAHVCGAAETDLVVVLGDHIWVPYGQPVWRLFGGLYESHVGPIWVTSMGDLYGAYISPLLHLCKSDELKMGPMWALNEIPIIKVGTIWAAHIGTIWVLETGSTWSPLWSPKHDRKSIHPLPKIHLISEMHLITDI